CAGASSSNQEGYYGLDSW
nr:immunoglobulin heavy chain junction region [Macaca mulatta]MOV39256.1 immunoglobulin heavy chain junction region [Macaca mulatta]MOV40663.1 immunoglobulin heavy chain junction region [Macaca mulatta]MOV40718.1 immunoglobulin heavy chain junction region [Macaca mulatta]MOV41348.1 immunoglobulin heavy chain junction region [Macaca mulatta]